MIDFKEIPEDGEVWELFARDFLEANGFFIESSVDRGPDGKKDLIISENLKGNLGNYRFKWLVSCKHNAKSGKSVNEESEPNILERVASFNCDGFIAFYSTVPSSGLNTRLTQLKDNKSIKDYRVFDYKLIENYLIRIGFSELVMRYFPISYKIIKPLHLVVDDYMPLECGVCGKDILQEMYQKTYHGLVAYAIKNDFENDKRYVKHIYWACKGQCDRQLEYHCRQTYDAITAWEDIGDIAIPAMFLRFVLKTLDQFKSGKWIYDDEVFEKEKYFFVALAQKVLREATEEEKKRTYNVMGTGFF